MRHIPGRAKHQDEAGEGWGDTDVAASELHLAPKACMPLICAEVNDNPFLGPCHPWGVEEPEWMEG